jgi:hypothetical protein
MIGTLSSGVLFSCPNMKGMSYCFLKSASIGISPPIRACCWIDESRAEYPGGGIDISRPKALRSILASFGTAFSSANGIGFSSHWLANGRF